MQCEKCGCELNEENTCCDGGVSCKACEPNCGDEEQGGGGGCGCN